MLKNKKNITQIQNDGQELKKIKEELEIQTWAMKKTNEAIKLLYKELEQKNEKLKELNKLKSEFVSIVSHEFRTPLSCIKESINITLDGTLGDLNQEQKEFLIAAKENIDRLSRLINDVLDYQKVEAGKMEYFIAEHDLNMVVKDACRIIQPLADKKGLTLNFQANEHGCRMKLDKDKIIQVLLNLINNAIKFTERGNVDIVVKDEQDNFHILVKDTGIGIAKEDIPRLFESFEQVGKGKKTGGTGLGLAISKKIIEAHNGKIWVESEQGQGTTFHFTLPKKHNRGKYDLR
ncbi:MAG: HAMP domain-containing sensor histidine kinase [Candidatus Omnitrophica bacterium]|nr:HAMP domain-containing sensor histidine kinase [Candidatus Omnitrophota bacterium]